MDKDDKKTRNTIESADMQVSASEPLGGGLETRQRSRPLSARASIVGRTEKLGEILVEQGCLTPDQAEKVFEHQQRTGLSFGEAARRLRLVKETDLKQALASQFGFPCIPAGDRSLDEELIAAYSPDSEYAESLRRLRTELLPPDVAHGQCQVIVVVSPKRGDGRTHLVANLGVVFAQLGKRVLLIDADLRQPRLHRLFKVSNECGVSVLLSARKCGKAVRGVMHFPSMDVLAAGPTPPNPQELVAGEGMASLIRSARRRYDVVLIDTPPAARYSDAEILSQVADSALIVARRNKTQQHRLNDLAARLRKKDVKVAGCVLVD